ncbi:alpha/beta fold hydrolase [Legionella tunisiensis]|uniref:alpha/beta fold hydrolase n=1 Tax=Legionella tunisiensis TaxID=1034944 RepID=UPI0003752301|nr:alpha/beta fold hydrolase [Legionella tunisiensis]
MNLHINIQGKGRPLVLFHGWGFDHRIWLQLARLLSNRYCLYLVDLPGFGQSSLMSWDIFKKQLLQQLPKHFAIAGWSMGGLFATRLAIEESERITYLLNIASSPRFIKEKNWPGVEQAVFDNFFLKLASEPTKIISEFVALQLKDQSFHYSVPPNLSLPGLETGLQVLADWDLRQSLYTLTKPTGFIFGRLDAITPRMTMAIMQKRYPNFDYVMFDNAAHMPFLSDQDEFIAILERILR